MDDIERKLISVLENRRQITSIGYESRTYVEKIHDYKKVAELYVKTWSKDS